jgi:hypothetical protein
MIQSSKQPPAALLAAAHQFGCGFRADKLRQYLGGGTCGAQFLRCHFRVIVIGLFGLFLPSFPFPLLRAVFVDGAVHLLFYFLFGHAVQAESTGAVLPVSENAFPRATPDLVSTAQ